MATSDTGSGLPGIRDLIDATYLGLVALQAGIGALTLPDAWGVVVPLAVAVGVAFFARLSGRMTAAAEITRLRDQVGRLLIENGDLAQKLGVALDSQNSQRPA